MRLTKGQLVCVLIFSLLVIDQIVKIWIKTHMVLGESIPVFGRFRIENKSYGICRETGKLIQKGRLLLVPHATLSVEAKNKRD